jgi:hypothetical protein
MIASKNKIKNYSIRIFNYTPSSFNLINKKLPITQMVAVHGHEANSASPMYPMRGGNTGAIP